jgi:hypothetical protein
MHYYVIFFQRCVTSSVLGWHNLVSCDMNLWEVNKTMLPMRESPWGYIIMYTDHATTDLPAVKISM